MTQSSSKKSEADVQIFVGCGPDAKEVTDMNELSDYIKEDSPNPGEHFTAEFVRVVNASPHENRANKRKEALTRRRERRNRIATARMTQA